LAAENRRETVQDGCAWRSEACNPGGRQGRAAACDAGFDGGPKAACKGRS